MRTVAAICRELIPDRRTDGELLSAFAVERSEEAFFELVRRHGPLVWGACRRLLPDPADAEDAFQAAFLVLVRRAPRLTQTGAIGPWIHRVAVWTARNARRKNARRLARQHALPEHVPGSAPDADLKTDIDGALLALPARYRDPIILCHLQGFTRREAAERLGCAEGTLSAWLNRGLAKLRTRLRDFDPTKVLPALGVAATVAVPAALSANTARAAISASVAAGTLTPAVSSIVEGVLHMLWIKKATATTFALCAMFALGVGVGLGTRTDHSGAVAQDGAKTGAAPKPNADPKLNPRLNPNPKPETPAELAQVEKQAQDKQAELNRITELRRQMDAELSASKAELEALKRSLLQLKGAEKTAQDSKTELLSAEVAAQALETAIRVKEVEYKKALAAIDAAKKKFESTKALPEADPKAILEILEAITRAQKSADASAAELKTLKEKLVKLKAPAKKGVPVTEKPNENLRAIEAQLEELKAQLRLIEAESADARRRSDVLAERAKAIRDAAAAVESRRSALLRSGTGATKSNGYLELTISGKAGSEFVIREVPPTDPKYTALAKRPLLGPITTSDPAALVVLLTRAKNDPNGPQEARILAQRDTPTERLRAALDACKSAGFQKVDLLESRTSKTTELDPMSQKEKRFAPFPGDDFLNKFDKLDKLDKFNKAEFEEHFKKFDSFQPKPKP